MADEQHNTAQHSTATVVTATMDTAPASSTSVWTDGNLRSPPSSRMLSTQLAIASLLGVLAVSLFAALRRRFPHVFMARLSYLQKLQAAKNRSRRSGSAPGSGLGSRSATSSSNGTHSQSDLGDVTEESISASTPTFTRSFLNIANKSFLNTLYTLHKITDEEIVDFAGLDAYVFLGFFKMAIKLLFVCWFFAVTIISPIRYHYTGNYDQGDGSGGNGGDVSGGDGSGNDGGDNDSDFYYNNYLLIYVVFTYLFTYITCHFLVRQAERVIRKRQEILGKQNSITDRTIRISGIPPELRSDKTLKETIENLKIGEVERIVICREWNKLNSIMSKRSNIIKKLEFYWSNYMEIINPCDYDGNAINDSIRLSETHTGEDNLHMSRSSTNTLFSALNDAENGHGNGNDNGNASSFYTNATIPIQSTPSLLSTVSLKSRPKIRTGFLNIMGPSVDALDYYTHQLSVIDEEILKARSQHYAATPTAFVTMNSVATAQTLAQAVIDPRIGYLITSPAPAPADIIWQNATLPSHSRKLKIYYITVITGIFGVIFIFPVGYLATLLNYKSIKKFWPDLARFLLNHEWASKIVIDLLPVYLYTLLNGIIPFLYVWLSSKQGFISHGEEELSVVSKNFFYVFVNLFLVFTMAGTASNYWGYLSDSKKLALQLAQSLRGLSSFYVDTIVLQGIGLMPFKLLPMGRIFQFIYFWFTHSKLPKSVKRSSMGVATARELTALYQPPDFNFGLQLPHPLLTLVITLIYSVISTKILSAGLMYFVIGYYVYKYLLIYTYVHPQHSTGKVMPVVFRRVILGLLLFQLTSAGSLILEKSWVLAACLAPLPVVTLMVLWYFQDKLQPLSVFIALRAIEVDSPPTIRYRDAPSANSVEASTRISEANNIQLKSKHTKKQRFENEPELDTSVVWADNNLFERYSDDAADDRGRYDASNNDTNANGYSNTGTSKLPRAFTDNLKTTATIDERREVNQSYDYPALVGSLEGPWIGMENASGENGKDTWILVWTSDGIVRKRVTNETDQIDA